MQRLINVWAGVEQSITDDTIDRRAGVSMPAFET